MHANKPTQIIRGVPHGQHNDIRAVLNRSIDLRLRVWVQRIDARHDLCAAANGSADFCDILRHMIGLHSIHAALPLGLAQHLHINENAVNARVRRNFCDRRVVGDVHKFQHLISLRPSRRY